MSLSWPAIARLGLVQAAIGAIVVLTTSTLNRLMVVELALPAVLPGALVALHYGVQMSRPRWGFESDTAGRRTRFIVAGMGVLALGAFGAASGVALMASSVAAGLLLSVVAYVAIGLGVGAAGTSLFALLATATAPERRPAAATLTWMMMIAGIALTAAGAGAAIDPYSPARLLLVVACVGAGAVAVATLAVLGVERGLAAPAPDPAAPNFRAGLAEIWAEPRARRFTLFVFLSMVAYFMQELILEPYAGLVFGFTPGQSTTLSGAQNGGVFAGLLAVGVGATGLGIGTLRFWVVAGCLGSAIALLAVAGLGLGAPRPGLFAAVATLGFFNGVFAVAAIATMMQLAGQGRARREGTRMGLWGAAQALAAGFGGLAGAGAADLMRLLLERPAPAFAIVFAVEAALFVAAALMAARILAGSDTRAPGSPAAEPPTAGPATTGSVSHAP